MNKRTWTRRQTLQGLAAGIFCGTALRSHASGSRLVLGQSAAFSGPAAQLGIQMNLGARMYFDAVNAAGGIDGRQIELQTLDDGYEPDRCEANTKKLIDAGVFALFGYVGTPTSLMALPLANAAKVPFFAPFTGAQGLRDPFSRYAFHVRASYFDETAEIVKHVTSLGMQKIAVFYQNDSYGKAGLAGVTRALQARSLAPVGLGTVERNTVAVDEAVAAIVKSRPDAVVQISAYRSCAAFIREARKAGYGGTFYNVSFVGTKALSDELGADSRGVVVSQVVPYPFAAVTGLSREYLTASTATGSQPNYSSMEGYVAAKVFCEGLKRMHGGSNVDAFIAGLESIDTSFGGFNVSFGPHKHTGSTFVDLTMLAEYGRVRR